VIDRNMRLAMLTRQADLIPAHALDEKISIVGAGAIGSWLCLALAKAGFWNISVADDDEVSVENMNSQFFPLSAIGKPKTQALAEMVRDFTGYTIETTTKRVRSGADFDMSGITVAAVDSMEARSLIFKASTGRWFIDPRMGAESALLYVVDRASPKSVEGYLKTLYADADSVQERCTAKATIYTANMLAGLTAKVVKDCAIGNGEHPALVFWNIKSNSFEAM
jgi:molybdopterin/thiamine biosynthesis adenylyltransferase